ncbi:hypothetical protein Tco_0883508 [Tanacetum coccineum]
MRILTLLTTNLNTYAGWYELRRAIYRTAEAVAILEEAVSRGHKYLTETKYESHVTVYSYPKGIKAFDMKVNPDKKTAAVMDVLVPKTNFTFCVMQILDREQDMSLM